MAGRPVADDPVGVRARLGFMPEHDCLPLDQTAADVVSTFGELAGLPPGAARQRASEVLDLVGLDEARFRPVGGFSTGMRQRTKLAQAIVADPELVLLDEPTAGLDPLGREEMLALVARLAGFGISLLVATHLLDDVQRVCDQVVLHRRRPPAPRRPHRGAAAAHRLGPRRGRRPGRGARRGAARAVGVDGDRPSTTPPSTSAPTTPPPSTPSATPSTTSASPLHALTEPPHSLDELFVGDRPPHERCRRRAPSTTGATGPTTASRGGRGAARGALVRLSVRRALGLRRSWRQKVFPWTLLGIATIPAIVNVGVGYLTRDSPGRGLRVLHLPRVRRRLHRRCCCSSPSPRPTSICPDRRNRVLPLIFARPLTGTDYVVAKVGAIAGIVFGFGFLPQVVLFVGQTCSSTDDGALDYFKDNAEVLWQVPVAVARAVDLLRRDRRRPGGHHDAAGSSAASPPRACCWSPRPSPGVAEEAADDGSTAWALVNVLACPCTSAT